MKIVLVTNSLSGGGAERAINLASNSLMNLGLDVFLIPINQSSEDLVEVHCKLIPLNRNPQVGMFGTVITLLKFRAVVRGLKPNLIVLNCDLPELFGTFLPLATKILVIEHANPAWSTRQAMGRVVRFLLRLRKTTFAAVSDHLKIWPSLNSPEFILPNLLIENYAGSLLPQEKSQIKRLVFIGRLERRQKQPHLLLEIALETNMPTLFIGSGSERANLEEESMKLGLHATFHEFTKNPWKLISQGDLLIIPSTFEGDGLVVLEALKLRCPFLLSDIDDFRRFKLADNFYCKSHFDYAVQINKFRNSLERLVPDPEVAISILEKRNTQVVLSDWDNVIKAITKQN